MKNSPLAAMIVSKKMGESPDSKDYPKSDMGMESDSAESDDEMGLTTSAEELIDAIRTKDAPALVAALKSFIEQC